MELNNSGSCNKLESSLESLFIDKILLGGSEFVNDLKISYFLGLGLGAMGRLSDQEVIPAIIPGLNFYDGVLPTTKETILICSAYGLGVATSYADKIYSTLSGISNNF